MIRIESDKMSYDILVPTEFSEITKEDIDALLAGVSVPEHYAVVALIYKERLYSVVSNVKNKKTSMVQCIPVLCKLHGDAVEAQSCRLMDKLIVANSSLERANIITIPENVLDPNTVGKYCNSDPDLAKSIILGEYFNDGTLTNHQAKELAPDCYFIDFRMIPVNEIVGAYKRDVKVESTFKVPKEPIAADGEDKSLLN